MDTAVRTEADPQLGRLLSLARTHLGMEVAWLSVFEPDRQTVVAGDGALTEMRVAVGDEFPPDASYCSRVLAGTLPPVLTDTRRHPLAREMPITQDLGIGSYVGVPWREADGSVGGMLCCLSRTAGPDLDDQSVRYLSLLADLVGDHLGSPAAAARKQARHAESAIREILETGAVRTVFQPIVRMTDGVPVAFEALSRFDDDPAGCPQRVFAVATGCGLGPDLELLAARCALERFSGPGWLGVNMSAETLMTAAARDLLLSHRGRRVAVEITEHTPVADYVRLTGCLRPLREAGFRIAVDDAGAGFAGLSHILQLSPDIIKLDIALVRGIDHDPVRRALARSLVGFAREIGAELLAEGVESRQEGETVRELGIHFGQGHLWGRPGPLFPL